MEHFDQPPFDWSQVLDKKISEDVPVTTLWKIYPGGFAVQNIPYEVVKKTFNKEAEGFAIHFHRSFLLELLKKMDDVDNIAQSVEQEPK